MPQQQDETDLHDLGAQWRLISVPVRNDGANMPTTWHWITGVTLDTDKTQPGIANGVAVITRSRPLTGVERSPD